MAVTASEPVVKGRNLRRAAGPGMMFFLRFALAS
jgi:hypothetical protein